MALPDQGGGDASQKRPVRIARLPCRYRIAPQLTAEEFFVAAGEPVEQCVEIGRADAGVRSSGRDSATGCCRPCSSPIWCAMHGSSPVRSGIRAAVPVLRRAWAVRPWRRCAMPRCRTSRVPDAPQRVPRAGRASGSPSRFSIPERPARVRAVRCRENSAARRLCCAPKARCGVHGGSGRGRFHPAGGVVVWFPIRAISYRTCRRSERHNGASRAIPRPS